MANADYATAIDSFQRARATMQQSGRVSTTLDIDVREELIFAMRRFPERRASALELARDTETYVAQVEGRDSQAYARALFELGRTLEINGQHAEGYARER